MGTASSAPGPAALVTRWTGEPVALIAAVLAVAWYLHSVHRLRADGAVWRVRHTVVFLVGVVLWLWVTCGFAQVYSHSLFWVWTAQTLALLLVVPLIVMAGQPVRLARLRHGGQRWLDTTLRSRFGRVLASPLVGPTVVPLLAVVLFFGPVPGWAIAFSPAGWLVHLAVFTIGAMIALPLVGVSHLRASLAVGLTLLVGMVELVLDAIPGIVLRLQTHTTTTFFAHRNAHHWSPSPLHDQQAAGAILWCLAEVVDLPFLGLMLYQWVRADRHEGIAVDTVLEAERLARAPLQHPAASGGESTAVSQDLWWLHDPVLRERFRP